VVLPTMGAYLSLAHIGRPLRVVSVILRARGRVGELRLPAILAFTEYAMPETPHHVAQVPPGGVRTPEPLSCPVCHVAPLRGRQTVRSPRCRAKRHRQRREERWQAQIQDVKSLLHAAVTNLENAR
jgi:hypothetical protein